MMRFSQVKSPSLLRYVHTCVYTEEVSLPRLNEYLSWQIESVIKSTGRRVCDLLSQQKLGDATAELEVRLYSTMAVRVLSMVK